MWVNVALMAAGLALAVHFVTAGGLKWPRTSWRRQCVMPAPNALVFQLTS